MKSRSRRITCIFVSVLFALLGSGCFKPDYLPVFETEKRYQQSADPLEPVEMLRDMQPQFVDDIIMELPGTGSLDLSVEQAVQLALRYNRDLKVEQINPVIAGTFESIERGAYDPEVFAEIEVSEVRGRETERTGERITVDENDETALLGVRQELPAGTMIEAAVGLASNDTDSDPEEKSVRVGLSVTQSLLRGFGPAVNLVSVRQAELDSAISKYELRAITEALLSDVEIAYWNYVLAGQYIDIFERSLSIAVQQLDEIEQRIEVGTLPRIEAAAAQAEVARREQNLIDVRSALDKSRLRLLRLMNPGREGQLDLKVRATSTAEFNPSPITDLQDRLELAAQSRPDLNEARLRLSQNRLETISTRNGLLPRLDLFIALGKSGYADSFSDSFKDLDGDSHDFIAGITLSQYLDNRRAKARDLAARASFRQARESVANLTQLVELDVRLAVNEFERTRQQITATRATRLLQEETWKAEKERFDVGASTALLVSQAQRDLLISAINEVESIVNCRQALVKLYLAEGSLLERRGVRLADSRNNLF